MRSIYALLTICLLTVQTTSAGLLEEFEPSSIHLQPVSAVFESSASTPDLHNCETCYPTDDSSSCRACETYGCYQPLVPNMIGDNGLLSPSVFGAPGTFRNWMNHASKIAENNSATPRNRVALNWAMSKDVRTGLGPTGGDSSDIQEFRFLMEKTILKGNASLELLIPFYHTTEFTRSLSGFTGNSMATELGDVAVGFKGLLLATQNFRVSTGVRMEIPTKDDQELMGVATSDNDIFAFTPYVAVEVAPQYRNWYFQMFGSARLNTDSFDATPPPISIEMPDYYMLDASVGYWLYRNPGKQGVTGLVPSLELHYTSSIDSWQPGLLLSNAFGQTDFLNLTAALTMIVNDKDTIAVAYAAPLRTNHLSSAPAINGPTDRMGNGSLLLQYNHFFGR